jgi:hypothetical protein
MRRTPEENPQQIKKFGPQSCIAKIFNHRDAKGHKENPISICHSEQSEESAIAGGSSEFANSMPRGPVGRIKKLPEL